MYPVVLKLKSFPCLVVGGGSVATRKVNSLLDAEARVTVVAPELSSELRGLAETKKITWLARAYREGDLEGYVLVIGATDSQEINHLVFKEASRRNQLVNCVDDPEHCSFFIPAVARQGDLMFAVSTNGTSPYLARKLREYLESKFYVGLDNDLDAVRFKRMEIRAASKSETQKSDRMKRELHPLVHRILDRLENL